MFNGIWLVACEPLTVSGREVQAGERFEISRTKSGALLVMGKALIADTQKAPPPEPEPEPVLRRRRPRKPTTPDSDQPESVTESAEPEQPEEQTVVGEPRRYQRRDLEAEE